MPVKDKKNLVYGTSEWSKLAIWLLVSLNLLVLPYLVKIMFMVFVNSFNASILAVVLTGFILLCIFSLFLMSVLLFWLGFRFSYHISQRENGKFEFLTYTGKKLFFDINELVAKEPKFYKNIFLKLFMRKIIYNIYLQGNTLFIIELNKKEYYLPISDFALSELQLSSPSIQ